MRRYMLQSAVIASGFLAAALPALPQYTVSARPGAVNYLEGRVEVNGKPVAANLASRMFLGANDSLATTTGKAEILLTPGVFFRIGSGSELKMVSPSLTDTRVELVRGEAVVEVAQLVEGNNIQVLDNGATVHLLKMGIYQMAAGPDATVHVYEGKAGVDLGEAHLQISKGHELGLSTEGKVKAAKFDVKKDDDDLYAWSRTRDEYVSASSYAAAKSVSASAFSNSSDPYNSFGGYYGPGWMWNSGFNSYAWLPGEGAFFSPFGYGFFAPGFVGYAPVVYLNGGVYGNRPVAVPVNPTKLPTTVSASAVRPAVASQTFARSQWAAAGIGSAGGHVSARAITSQSRPGGGSTGSGFSGPSGAMSGSSSASSARMSSSAPSGGHSSGGGGHK